MATYDVILRLDEKRLPTLLQTIQGYAKLQNISVVSEYGKEPEKEKRSSPHYRDGKRDKGISGEALVMEILSSEKRVFKFIEIASIFAQRGFAGNSASPALSKLKNEGKIRQVGQGLYELSR